MALRTRHILPVLVLSLTACGTTVPLSQQMATGPSPRGGNEIGDTTGTSGLSSKVGTTGGVSTTTSTGVGASSSGTSSGAGGATGGAATGLGTGGTEGGLKAGGPITVGIVVPDYAAVAAAFGVNGAAGDPFAHYKKMFAKINAKGGFAGHPVKVLYHKADGAGDQGTESQRACSYFTEDNKVNVAISEQFPLEPFLTCMRKKGIAVLETTRTAYDVVTAAQHPNWFPLDAMTEDRYVRQQLQVSAQQGVLKSIDTLGVLMPDCVGEQRVYKNTIQPMAKKLGLKAVVQSTTNCGGAADLGSITSQIQAAVLKFSANNVTQVLTLTPAEGLYTVVFTRAASQQQYYPKYILSSNAFPYSNSDTSTPASFAADAMPNMTGVGWIPIMDTGDLGAKPVSAAQAAVQNRCKRYDPTMAGWSSDTGKRRWEKAYFFYAGCDVVLMLEKIVTETSGNLSVAAVVQAYTKWLPLSASAALAGGRYSAPGGRRDGAGQVQPFAYNTSCSCFKTTGPARSAD